MGSSNTEKVNFRNSILDNANSIVRDCMWATHFKIDPFKRMNCFEILAYDFLLVQANGNHPA